MIFFIIEEMGNLKVLTILDIIQIMMNFMAQIL
jgi:hypothetical protein